MANVVFFSVVELLCGFSPNYTFFLVLRTIYGIGMGGEWGVGCSLAMESIPPKRRGIISSLTETQMTDSAENVSGRWRYERLEGPGHWMQLEAPDKVNELLLDFLPR